MRRARVGPVTHINASAKQSMQLAAARRNRAQSQASCLALLRSTSGPQATREARIQCRCVALVLAQECRTSLAA